MRKFLEVKLYDKSKVEDEKQVVILNPLAISSIIPGDEKDIIKMQNGDVYEVEHKLYSPTTGLHDALKQELTQSIRL